MMFNQNMAFLIIGCLLHFNKVTSLDTIATGVTQLNNIKVLYRSCFYLVLTIFNVKGLFDIKVKSSIRPSIYLSLIVKSRSNPFWNQPVLSNMGKVSCSRKQWGPLMGLEPTTPLNESDVHPTAPRRESPTKVHEQFPSL